MSITANPLCDECGLPMELAGYMGDAGYVTEAYVCPRCSEDEGGVDVMDEDGDREIGRVLDGRWEK